MMRTLEGAEIWIVENWERGVGVLESILNIIIKVFDFFFFVSVFGGICVRSSGEIFLEGMGNWDL